MLSRRGVRIKILQLLYRFDRDSQLDKTDAVKLYRKDVNNLYDLYLYNIYTLVHIIELSLEDSKKRTKKHIVTDFDKIFTPKFYTNASVQAIKKNGLLRRDFDVRKFDELADKDFYSKIYKKFVKTAPFIAYIEDDNASHTEQLLELYRFCRQDDFFNEKMEEFYALWPSDKSMVIGGIKKYIKTLDTESEEFYKTLYPDAVTTEEYGTAFLKRVLSEDNKLDEIIQPVLENWDASRLAIIDKILIKMALVEFLYFETIPTKVTLNEYVELSKMYSTPKSKEFVNGVLDKLLKKLTKTGEISKAGRGLIE